MSSDGRVDVVSHLPDRHVENEANSDVGSFNSHDEILDDDASAFTTETIAEAEECDDSGNLSARPTVKEAAEAVDTWDDMEEDLPPMVARGAQIQPPTPTPQIQPPTNPKDDATVPSERSKAHYQILNEKAVFMSFDIETAGEFGGIVQMSAEMFRLNLVPGRNAGKKDNAISKRKDTAANVVRDPDTFNKYINPEARAIWHNLARQVASLFFEFEQSR